MEQPDVMHIRILAEFETPDAIESAVAAMKHKGYEGIDAFTPWDMEKITETLELPRGHIPLYTLLFGILGAILGYGIQWWTNAVDFPINVGARPLNPIPSFVMITFETTVLFASLGAFLGVWAGSRLPMLWQPLFEVPGFERATDDRFFIGIDERDPLFQFERTRDDLLDFGAVRVERVPERWEIVEREKRASRLRQRGTVPPVDPGEPGERVPPPPETTA